MSCAFYYDQEFGLQTIKKRCSSFIYCCFNISFISKYIFVHKFLFNLYTSEKSFSLQIFLCKDIQPTAYPPKSTPTKCDKKFLSILMLPKQLQMYCFQLQLGLSFNLILERKPLLHFPTFVPHAYYCYWYTGAYFSLFITYLRRCFTLQLSIGYIIYFKYKSLFY